jgi:hypothetical protein
MKLCLFAPQPDLGNLNPEQLKDLFKMMDADGSGQITADEAHLAISKMWPLLDESAMQIAFDVADRTHAGVIGLDGVLVLLRCIIWLNRKRHPVAEILGHFGREGVGESEFRLGCKVMGVLQNGHTAEENDATASKQFAAHSAALVSDPRPVLAQPAEALHVLTVSSCGLARLETAVWWSLRRRAT